MEGNFTHSLTIQQVESMLGSFNLTNTSSTFSSQNVTTTKQEIPLVQNLDRNYDLVIDFDRNLVDTLSRIIISALRQSNLSSQLLDSSQTSDLNELGQYSIDGKWNASIVARNMANFSGLIEARNIIDGQLQYFKVSLVADTKEIEYLEREGNVTIVIKGNATVNIDNQQIEVPTILVIREMKQIYMLMLGDSDLLPNKFFLYGKVSRISA
jgi:hypothetical protein